MRPMARVNCVASARDWRQDRLMKRSALTVTMLVAWLAACAPLQTYYKPGAAVSTLNRDTTNCQVRALRDVPPSTLTRRKPPIWIPGNRTCDADGNCRGHHGYYIPGGIETYDPNEGLRLRVERQCMADRGYVPVSIPQCPDSVSNAVPARATTRLPALTESSCVIRNSDGTFQIVSRG